MEVCHHLIKKEQIVGIGPLMTQFSNDQAFDLLYGASKLYFYLHLKTTSIKIESDWFYKRGVEPHILAEHKNLYTDFRNGYQKARKTIEELIS